MTIIGGKLRRINVLASKGNAYLKGRAYLYGVIRGREPISISKVLVYLVTWNCHRERGGSIVLLVGLKYRITNKVTNCLGFML